MPVVLHNSWLLIVQPENNYVRLFSFQFLQHIKTIAKIQVVQQVGMFTSQFKKSSSCCFECHLADKEWKYLIVSIFQIPPSSE